MSPMKSFAHAEQMMEGADGTEWGDAAADGPDAELQSRDEAGLIGAVRALLWDEQQECCGRPVVGAEYMGQQELVCCGCPEFALLSDAQIVATLRALFPQPTGAAS